MATNAVSSINRYYNERYSGKQSESAPEATFLKRVDTALKSIDGTPRRILDYGCGRGTAAGIFNEAGHEVVGVDIAENLIAFARQSVPEARFELIESECSLPFPDASFDVCFSSEVIEHLFDVKGFVSEVNRVLRKGGQLLLTTPYHGLVKNFAIVAFNFEKHFNVYGGHIRFFSKRSIRRVLEDGGFRVERVNGIGRLWPLYKTMFVAVRKDS